MLAGPHERGTGTVGALHRPGSIGGSSPPRNDGRRVVILMPAASSSERGPLTGTEPLAERDAALLRAAGAERVALLLHHGAAPEMRLLHPDHPVVIGRKPAQGWGVADRKLSREHARFSLSLGRVLVEDLGSTNGTWLAGARVSRAEIDVGDEVRLADVLVRVQLLGPEGEELGV